MSDETDKTQIQIGCDTRDALKEEGNKGESYDDVITRLKHERDQYRNLVDEEEGLQP